MMVASGKEHKKKSIITLVTTLLKWGQRLSCISFGNY